MGVPFGLMEARQKVAEISLRKGETALLTALAAGHTVRDAARMAGIGERTAYRRLDHPDFRERLENLKTQATERAMAALADAATGAVSVLVELMASASSEAVRLGAARAVLTLSTGQDAGDHHKRRHPQGDTNLLDRFLGPRA